MNNKRMRIVAKCFAFLARCLGWFWLVTCIYQSIRLGFSPLAGLGVGLLGLVALYFGTVFYLDFYHLEEGEYRKLAEFASRHPEVRKFLLAEVARDPQLTGRTYAKAKHMTKKLDRKMMESQSFNEIEQAREELLAVLQK